MFICSASPADGTQVNGNERTTEFFRINLYQAWRGGGGVSPPPILHHYFIGEQKDQKRVRREKHFTVSSACSNYGHMDSAEIASNPCRNPQFAEVPKAMETQHHLWRGHGVCAGAYVPCAIFPACCNSSAAEERFQALDPTKCISNPTPANCRVRTILTPFTGISELPPRPGNTWAITMLNHFPGSGGPWIKVFLTAQILG